MTNINIGELELKMMQTIGKTPKLLNLPIDRDKKLWQLGTKLDLVKEDLTKNYEADKIDIALENLRNLGYILEFMLGKVTYIAVTPKVVERYKINYEM